MVVEQMPECVKFKSIFLFDFFFVGKNNFPISNQNRAEQLFSVNSRTTNELITLSSMAQTEIMPE